MKSRQKLITEETLLALIEYGETATPKGQEPSFTIGSRRYFATPRIEILPGLVGRLVVARTFRDPAIIRVSCAEAREWLHRQEAA